MEKDLEIMVSGRICRLHCSDDRLIATFRMKGLHRRGRAGRVGL